MDLTPPSIQRPVRGQMAVAIGASAGGLRALEEFFHNVGGETGCAFVVVQHLSPEHKSYLPELLGRHTRMPIETANAGDLLLPDHVYLAPAGRLLGLSDGRFVLRERNPAGNLEMPINTFFSSLARECGPDVVGIVLSGTGTDGTEGVRTIHANGGMVLVQDPEQAEFDSMPKSALTLDIADHILRPAEMGRAIVEYSRNRRKWVDAEVENPRPSTEDVAFQRLVQVLQRVHGLDFGHYKMPTIERRVRRRMTRLKESDLNRYVEAVASRRAEADALLKDLLIGVTEFFRDPTVFDTLRDETLRAALAEPKREEFRGWIVACATGEEAYSVAIVLDEIATEVGFHGKISLFATDVHPAAIEHASAGLYRPEELAHLSVERLARYFKREEGGMFRVIPSLRSRIVFAQHNFLSDPPFTKLDLVTCRNFLIYLNTSSQEQALGIVHFGLRPQGALLLGISETVGRLDAQFETVNATHKLYRKRPVPVAEVRKPLSITLSARSFVPTQRESTAVSRSLLNAYDRLLGRQLSAGFIVSETGQLLHSFAEASRYLRPESGRASPLLLDRCDGALRAALVMLLRQVFDAGRPAEALGVELLPGSPASDLRAEIVTDEHAPERLALVSIRPSPGEVAAPAETDPAEAANLRSRIAALEKEVQTSRADLEALVLQLQRTNEEQQTSHEEIVASNEELQTTNEELHSVNEELRTVNDELEEKNLQLRVLNEDLDNLFRHLDVGIVLLDREQRIRRFNEPAAQVFHLLPGDVGRPLAHLHHPIVQAETFARQAHEVIARGKRVDLERDSGDGRVLSVRLLPYQSDKGRIAGAVMIFSDVTDRRQMQHRIEVAMEASKLVWWEWDLERDLITTHAGDTCILGYDPRDLQVTSAFWMERVHAEDLAAVRGSLQQCTEGHARVWICDHRYRDSTGNWIWVRQSGRVIAWGPNGQPLRMLGTTQRTHEQRMAVVTQAKQAALLTLLQDSVVTTNVEGEIEFWNPMSRQYFGLTETVAMGQPVASIFPSDVQPRLEAEFRQLEPGDSFQFAWRRGEHHYTTRVQRVTDSDIVNSTLVFITHDDTVRTKEDERRRAMEKQLLQSQKMETLGTLAGGIAHDFNNILAGILGSVQVASIDLPVQSPARKILADAQHGCERASQLVRQILAFSRTGTLMRERVVLQEYIEELMPLLRTAVGKSIAVELHLDAGRHAVLADRGHLQQVLLNLAVNSAQSMGGKSGTLSIALQVVNVEGSELCAVGQLSAGTYLKLTVSDEGAGIPAEVLPRIFEPFFTTKETGKGTGMGLSIVHGVVLSHAGAVRVNSLVGRGTAFEVFLPEAPAGVSDSSNGSHPPIPVPSHAPVAVIDDDEIVLHMTKVLLEKHGYAPSVFANATDFLEKLSRSDTAHGFRVIITDQMMPHMTGIELIRNLRGRGDNTPVVLISGFTRDIPARDQASLQHVRFVAKPFESEVFLTAVAGQMQEASRSR